MSPLSQYDRKQLRKARRKLAAALFQLDLTLEPTGRNIHDRRFRCMFAASYAVEATKLLDEADRRLARRSKEAMQVAVTRTQGKD